MNGVVVIGYLFKATVDFINVTNDDRDNPPNSTIVQCLTTALLVDQLFRSFSPSYLSVVIVRTFLYGISYCIQRM